MDRIFIDFEVFKYDWLCVCINPSKREETVIVNDSEQLRTYYEEHKRDIFIGFNIVRYDQYIMKAILLDMNPKEINDYIIVQGLNGYLFSRAFNRVSLIIYDIMNSVSHSLKYYEGEMGNDIRESGVDFNLDRKLTEGEILETIDYCRHDVEQSIELYLKTKKDFDAHMALIDMYRPKLDYMDLAKTKVQLSCKILDADKKTFNDEWDVIFPETMRIKKYKHIVEWYKHEAVGNEEATLDVKVAGVPHTFAWGGVHGARLNYIDSGSFINMDVASLYPSLMINYNLLSRCCKPENFKGIVDKRLELKRAKDSRQSALKIVINGTYGASLQKGGVLYDARMGRSVCLTGQLLLLDLVEHLEPFCEIIQTNTDGILLKYDDTDKTYSLIDDIAHEWEKRTGLTLEFENFKKVIQKDVNNYLIVSEDGHVKSKGAWVKELNDIDNDLLIVNKAIAEYFINDIAVETTITSCDKLKDFQLVCKISSKYEGLYHGAKKLNEKCVRVFASKEENDKGLFKKHATTGAMAKFPSSPTHSRIICEDVNDAKVPDWLDKKWYMDLANKRIRGFYGETDKK